MTRVTSNGHKKAPATTLVAGAGSSVSLALVSLTSSPRLKAGDSNQRQGRLVRYPSRGRWFLLHRPPNGEVSTGWHRKPCGAKDVLGGVHVSMVGVSALGALKGRLALAAFRVHVRALVTRLRGVRRVDQHDAGPGLAGCVAQR